MPRARRCIWDAGRSCAAFICDLEPNETPRAEHWPSSRRSAKEGVGRQMVSQSILTNLYLLSSATHSAHRKQAMLASPMPSSPSTSERQRFGMRNMFSFVKAPRVNKRPALSRPASKEYRGPYINSKTPKKDLPQTWEEWNDAYSKVRLRVIGVVLAADTNAQGLIEFEDPPLPPAPSSDAPKASFSELGFFIPPPHPNERRRQQSSSAFRLSQCEDLVGSHCYPVPGNNPELIEVHLPLRALTTEAMTRFGTNGVQVSILDEGMLFYLAEVGFGLGVLKRESKAISSGPAVGKH